jgi:hypothetical protein
MIKHGVVSQSLEAVMKRERGTENKERRTLKMNNYF